MKALRWQRTCLRRGDVFKCIDCSLTHQGKSKLTTFQRVKSHPGAAVSPGNLVAGLLSSTGANAPSFSSPRMCVLCSSDLADELMILHLQWWLSLFFPMTDVSPPAPVKRSIFRLSLSALCTVPSSISSWKIAASDCGSVSYFLLG